MTHDGEDLIAVDPMRLILERQARWELVSGYLHVLRTTLDSPTAQAFLAARGGVLRTLAQTYSDHPDYREEWDTVVPLDGA